MKAQTPIPPAMEAPAEASPSAEIGAYPAGLKLAYEIALRRYDFMDRTFDTVTTRFAGLIALTGFLVPATKAVLTDLKPYPKLSLGFGVTMLFLIVTDFVWCVRGYRLQPVRTLTDAEAILNQHSSVSEDELRAKLLTAVSEMTNQTVAVLDKKRRNFDCALVAFVLAWTTIALFSVLSYR